jgi:hypothetical protein
VEGLAWIGIAVAVVVGYFAVMRWVLPRFGIQS